MNLVEPSFDGHTITKENYEQDMRSLLDVIGMRPSASTPPMTIFLVERQPQGSDCPSIGAHNPSSSSEQHPFSN